MFRHPAAIFRELLYQRCGSQPANSSISVINQLEAQNFCFTISFISYLYMFRAHVLIIRRSKLHYTASGIITPIGGRLVHSLCTSYRALHHPHRTHDLRSGSQDHHPSKNSVQETICCNSKSNAPDDGHL